MRAFWMMALIVALAASGCVGTTGPEGVIMEDGSTDLSFYGVDDDPFLGNADAPVQVVAYDAPGCPSCKRYHDTEYPAIRSEYIDSGRIGYHFVQWRVGYPYDIQGGIAEECVFREGGSEAYEEMVDRVFANQGASGRTENLPDILRQVAADLGLDGDVLVSCYENEETRDEVEADIAAGKASGAGHNPGFVVLRSGADPVFIKGSHGPGAAIEEALAVAQS